MGDANDALPVAAGDGARRVDRARLLAFVVSAGLVCAAVLVLRAAGFLQGFELAAYDRLLRGAANASNASESPVVIVEITEADIREQGHWPISDRTLADALLVVRAAAPRAIGLDLYRDLGVPPGQERFQRVLRETPNLIAVFKFGDPDRAGIPGPAALVESGRVGFNDVVFDADETVRRALLFQDDGEGAVESSFALRLALVAAGVAPAPDPVHAEWLRLGPTTVPPFEANDGGYVGADAAGYQFLTDFARGRSGFATITLGQLLRREVDSEVLRGKVVMVGSNAKSLPDLFVTPLGGRIAGVELHAHMVDQLVRFAGGESAPLRVLPAWQEVALIVLAGMLGGALAFGARGNALFGAFAPVLIAASGVALFAAAAYAAFRAGAWLPAMAPALAWVGATGLVTAWLSSRERVERAQLMGLFARHVSPEVAEEIWRRREEFLDAGRPRPRRLAVTVLFVDMKGYSAHSRAMDPALLLEWVNDFLARMAREVERHGGVIEDYFGDGFKANFGFPIPRTDPDEIRLDAVRAVESALAMVRSLEVLNAEVAPRGLPEIDMRVGIDSGDVVVGSIGSEDHLKVSVVGDVVVTAQRLEGTAAVAHDFAKAPCRILISDRTRKLVGDRFAVEPAGTVALKGHADGVSVYRVLGASGAL